MFWVGLFELLGSASYLFADQEGSRSFTLDLPATQNQALPAWITKVSTFDAATFSTLDFAITPPSPGDSDLAVTFYFQDPKEGFLRVFWAGATKAEMLSENLAEGIGLPNQRTLLIRKSLFSAPGALSVQFTEGSSSLWRVHWEWVRAKPVLQADGALSLALLNSWGNTMETAEANGDPLLPPSDRLQGRTVTAVLAGKPVRIENGVIFTAPIQETSQWAKVEAEFSGVPLDSKLALWVNDVNMGEVSMDIPDFADPGYRANSLGKPIYAGWRKGVVYIPVENLPPGDNHFQFSWSDSVKDTQLPPVAVKNLFLQLKYPDLTPGSGGAAPAPSVNEIPKNQFVESEMNLPKVPFAPPVVGIREWTPIFCSPPLSQPRFSMPSLREDPPPPLQILSPPPSPQLIFTLPRLRNDPASSFY